MLLKKIFLTLLVCLIFLNDGFCQNGVNSKINTMAAEEYIKLIDIYDSAKAPEPNDWQSLFNSPIYMMMISGGAFDTSKFKNETKNVFTSKHNDISDSSFSEKELYHRAYQQNKEKLKNYIVRLKSDNLIDSIKNLVFPFLPDRLRDDNLFPVLFYLNYGTPEASGDVGLVLNDLLFSYKVDQYKFGIVAAHESFHAIVSTAFQRAVKEDVNHNSIEFKLFYFLETISQEGVADLIDKPLLEKPESPVFSEVTELLKDDQKLSIFYLKKLDSLFHKASSSKDALANYKDYNSLTAAFGKNGGHIPGRYMAKAIADAGLIQKFILEVEDPISFFITYNLAAKSFNRNEYPIFCNKSIEYLMALKDIYFKK